MKNGRFYFYPRSAAHNAPAGMTVSKLSKLPEGDFRITEYTWGDTTLWFIDKDLFTAGERNEAFHACSVMYMSHTESEECDDIH